MPLEQLLSLYGYGAQSSGPSSSSEPRTTSTSQFDTSMRPRRKRTKGAKMALGNAGKTISSPSTTSSSSLPPLSNRSLHPDPSSSNSRAKEAAAAIKVEGNLSEAKATTSDGGGGKIKNEHDDRIKWHPKEAIGVSILTRDTNITPEKNIPSNVRIRPGRELNKKGLQAEERMKESRLFKHEAKHENVPSNQALKQDGGAFSELETRQEVGSSSDRETEQEDTTDVEVVEDDGMGMGLEVRLGERDEGLLQLAEMEREGLNVVRMGDIEAGLSKGEGLFPPLGLLQKEDLIGGSGAYSVDVGFEAGDWGEGEGVGIEGGVPEQEEEEEGMEEEEKERMEEEKEGSGVVETAVYDDVMLSSSSNSRLLSDSSGMFSLLLL